MRTRMLGLAVLLSLGLAAPARAEEAVPPVLVGPVVITGVEAEKMINELSHHRHERYRAGRSLDWLYASPVQPTLAPGIPPVFVNGVLIVGFEAEEMIDRLSHLRRHGHWRAGMPLDWLGIPSAMPRPVMVPVAPMPMAPPPMPMPMVMMAPPPPAQPERKQEDPGLGRVLIGVGAGGSFAQGHLDEAALSLGLTVEGKRWGFNLNASGTLAQAGDTDRSFDLKMIDAHLLFAPIVGERGRVRIEAGAALAIACDALLLAPELGLSGDVRIVGPLGLTGFVRGAVWPYKRIDAWGGIYGQLWVLRAELGWRETRMEANLPDNAYLADRWSGPYLGLTLVF